MKAEKIVWDRSLDDPNTQVFIITVDGVDCHIWEPKHPTLPIDKAYWSHNKFNKAAVKYEIGINVFESKCVWIKGPVKPVVKNLPTFKQELKHKIMPNKLVIADTAYQSSEPDLQMLATPNTNDSSELKNFKSRARLRHETFNGRLKFFKCLADVFRHGVDKHKMAFEAVCVIVQYQMDNGAELYAV